MTDDSPCKVHFRPEARVTVTMADGRQFHTRMADVITDTLDKDKVSVIGFDDPYAPPTMDELDDALDRLDYLIEEDHVEEWVAEQVRDRLGMPTEGER